MRSFILICVISAVYGEHRHIRQNSECGVPAYTPHTPPSRLAKIVGGREAVPHSWPWQAVLRFRDHSLTCGGSLIRTSTGELVVITAGQCVDGSLSSEWKVDVGVHSRSAMESNQKTYDVREIVYHENFNPYLLENDIAIVRLTTNVTENEAVKPICITTLPTSDFYGKQCVVTGWGATVEGGEPNDRLKEVYKPVLTDTECQTNIGGSFNGTIMLCAGYLQGGQGACAGDNGGPLSCKNANGQYDLIGLVSWGFGCAREGFPAVYADVHYYLDWINSHITAN